MKTVLVSVVKSTQSFLLPGGEQQLHQFAPGSVINTDQEEVLFGELSQVLSCLVKIVGREALLGVWV